MAVTRPEWAMSPLSPGPDAYAPPDRRPPEEPISGARIAALRPQPAEQSQYNQGTTGSLDALIQRIAATSMDEIDHVIRELESIREMLRNEGERVSREIVGYSTLSRASMTAMKVISDSLEVWKSSLDRSA